MKYCIRYRENEAVGFSLVELLVVIAVVSVLASLAVAGLSSKKGAEVSQAGALISGVVKLRTISWSQIYP